MTKHTPTPWHGECTISGDVVIHTENREELFILQNGSCSENKATAAFIVRACNSHDELVKALETARDFIGAWLDSQPSGTICPEFTAVCTAIAKAKGEA